MQDRQTELHRSLQESQRQYTYALLAVSVAVIGFALKETSGKALDASQLALGWAVILWALSFFYGCKHVQYFNSSLYANGALLQIENNEHPDTKGYSPTARAAAYEGVRKAFETNSDKANQYCHWQFRLLILGSLSYIAWHVLNMYTQMIMS
ncbi:MAG: hypothetical protein IPK84_01640 [Candidatus Moraniibacteriota bacterium]|nr:MAG: hypothetical protein IPK84_01640 [Candidatus Moranbacteria bacterium]